MLGGWAQRLFHASHDGKAVLAHRFDGLSVIRDGQTKSYKIPMKPGMRMITWAPDSKRFIFWHPEGVAVGNIDTLGDCEKPTFTLVYKNPKGRYPFAAGWCPAGNDVFILEHLEAQAAAPGQPPITGSAIQRVSAQGGTAREILNHPHRVSFFMPPVQRFENGSGPSSADYLICFGARDGLYVMDRNGERKQKVADFPPDVQDVVWSPRPEVNKFAFLYRLANQLPDGKTVIRGVYICHLDRLKKDPKNVVEQLDPSLDVHTLYFSHHGKYVSWASNQTLGIREPDAAADKTIKVNVSDFKAGTNIQIKSFGWDHTDSRVAITAGNRLYVFNVEKKTWQFLAKAGDEQKTFLFEPHWVGDDVIYSTFTNVGASKKRPSK